MTTDVIANDASTCTTFMANHKQNGLRYATPINKMPYSVVCSPIQGLRCDELGILLKH